MGMENKNVENNEIFPVIKVVGLGKSGTNTVNRMIESGVKYAEFITLNTDTEAVGKSKAEKNITIGKDTTGGRGADGYKLIGYCAAKDSEEEILSAIEGADMVITVTGLGGGTGTGALPVVSKLAKDRGILTLCFVTMPLPSEGKTKCEVAKEAVSIFKTCADSFALINCEKLSGGYGAAVSEDTVFKIADDILSCQIGSIIALVNENNVINLDFADLVSVLKDAGRVYIGFGSGSGEERAAKAADAVKCSPLFENKLNTSNVFMLNFVCSDDVTLEEIDSINAALSEITNGKNVIWGVKFDNDLDDTLNVMLLAAGQSDEG